VEGAYAGLTPLTVVLTIPAGHACKTRASHMQDTFVNT
jgi:hypothetical protein